MIHDASHLTGFFMNCPLPFKTIKFENFISNLHKKQHNLTVIGIQFLYAE